MYKRQYWDSPAPFLVRGLGKQKLIKECIARGKDFYFMDTGYLGNNPSPRNPNGKKTYHRIVKNALQNLHMPDRDENPNACVTESLPSRRFSRLAVSSRLHPTAWFNTPIT